MISTPNLEQAVKHLEEGHIIAYPTESVYGLGCDPNNEQAVKRIYQLKSRPQNKGLILIAADWQQIDPLIQPLPRQRRAIIEASWPGPVTWVFPATRRVPSWLVGPDNTIALRLTAHPIAKALCALFDTPIISTSANPGGQSPAKTAAAVRAYFHDAIDFIVEDKVGDLATPTPIYHAITGEQVRS